MSQFWAGLIGIIMNEGIHLDLDTWIVPGHNNNNNNNNMPLTLKSMPSWFESVRVS